MRALSCLLLFLFAASPAFAGIEAAAEAHSRAFAKAFNSKDQKAVLALYAKEARVIWPGQGEEANGTEQIRRLIAKTMKEAPKDLQVIFESQEIIPLGDKCFAVLGHWQETFTGTDGKKVTVDARTSEVLRRHEGKLLYVVDHASVGLPPAPPSMPAAGTTKKK